MNPIQLAKKLKRKFGENTTVYDLIDYFGIVLLEVDTKKFIAGYRFINRQRLIQVKQDLDEHLKTCVLWHELAHALCHREIDCYYMVNNTRLKTSIYEQEAEAFAAEWLLPDEPAEELKGRTLEEVAAYYEVTISLVETKWGK